jgi:serine/threonine protein kinase/class 3 adenylate cyclase/predicted ATPase
MPTQLMQYRVLRRLGAGAMGEVYLAEHTPLRRLCAVKVIRTGLAGYEKGLQRFEREVRAVASLTHPNTVHVYDYGRAADGTFFYAMEYLPGPTLECLCGQYGPLPPQRAIHLLRQVCGPLREAHRIGLVHRDVKPTNVIVCERGGLRDVVKLLDFGLVRAVGPGAADEKLTRDGMVTGTPAYMSPEQAEGASELDGRSDLYSLGAVAYFLLTGRPPFVKEAALQLLLAHARETVKPPTLFRPDVPPELEAVVMQCLEKDRGRRFPDAGALDEALAACQRGGPWTEEQAAEWWRSHPPAENSPAKRRAFTRLGPACGPRPAAKLRTTKVFPPESLAELSGVPFPDPDLPEAAAASVTAPAQRLAREAERRQVTVLVCGCEQFKSEPYLEGLDAEDQASVMRAFLQTCEQPVHRFGGTVVQCNDQRLLVCFGYPVAYEDGARRAAQAGLAILADMKALGEPLRRENQLKLDPWVILHTGPAVVEAVEGVVSLAGEARNVAVRLEDSAGAGQVICSQATHRLIRGHFTCASLDHRTIKGMAQSVELFHVQGLGEARNPVEAAGPAGLTPLTGRDHEVSLLKARWEQAQEGMGQFVLLIGEPGLGKSRLVYTMKQHVLGQTVEGWDTPVIEWRCSPHFQNTGLYPAIDFYERALAFGREELPQARFDRLLHFLEQYGLARPETVPLWAALLSLPTPDRFPQLALTPVRQREETFRALLEWLHTRAARGPVLFVVEDLHWVDASTLEFLGQLLAEGLHDSILTLLTFRPEFKTPWSAVAHQTSLALNRLTRHQVGELMWQKTGAPVPQSLVERVYDRTGGVPLFVEEFTQLVQESGALAHTGEDSPGTLGVLAHGIPATLQDLVMARLDRMDGDREVAQLAATLGRELSYELLAAVATVDEKTLDSELAKLVQAEILYTKGRPPRCTYIFKHALLEDALYNALVKVKRQQFHLRIAEVMEARFPQTVETQPELLAHHFTEANLTEKGIDYWLKAGRRSQHRSANAEAIGHLTKGLELVGALAESSPERDALELQFLNPLGTAYLASRGYAAPEVGPVFRRARELCERVGEPQQRFANLWGTWIHNMVRADFRLCMDQSAEALEFAERFDDPGMRREALWMSGATRVFRADFTGTRASLETALSLDVDSEQSRSWADITGQYAAVTSRGNLAAAMWHLGYPDRAQNLAREAYELSHQLAHPFSLGFALHCLGWVLHHCRIGAKLRACAEDQIRIAAEQGFAWWHAMGLLYKAGAMVLEGRPEEALSPFQKGLDGYRATGSVMALPHYLSMLVDAYTQAGRFEEAHRALNEALTLAEKNDDRFHQAELYRLNGELMLAESADETRAESCFRQAIETARRQQSKGWELRGTISLARLWRRHGRRDEARAALAAIYGTYTEGFTTPDLVDAAALLEALA